MFVFKKKTDFFQQLVVSMECQTFEGIFTCCKALLTDVIPLVARKKLPTISYAITHSVRNS